MNPDRVCAGAHAMPSMTSPAGYGYCRGCGRWVRVTRRGKLRRHRMKNRAR